MKISFKKLLSRVPGMGLAPLLATFVNWQPWLNRAINSPLPERGCPSRSTPARPTPVAASAPFSGIGCWLFEVGGWMFIPPE